MAVTGGAEDGGGSRHWTAACTGLDPSVSLNGTGLQRVVRLPVRASVWAGRTAIDWMDWLRLHIFTQWGFRWRQAAERSAWGTVSVGDVHIFVLAQPANFHPIPPSALDRIYN